MNLHRFPVHSLVAILYTMLLLGLYGAHARDDGRYAASPLKPWFDKLSSGKGRCCSDADGNVVLDADWESKAGHYRVRIDGNWHDVPDDAVVTEPNLFGRTMVWPMTGTLDANGVLQSFEGITIRCFMPGAAG